MPRTGHMAFNHQYNSTRALDWPQITPDVRVPYDPPIFTPYSFPSIALIAITLIIIIHEKSLAQSTLSFNHYN